ncbi:uncharacterized protein Z518_02442 [Rhinocladiella mackenziei CBS 650.93]|uniref:Acyltransferase MbtK/IucB-like conserved domain-containing protein n=1 Tax=Rhinocladiella mackenziei CBS 650.93 TaxID=1442369 RepID=A0A0D2HBI1_9EURO|nr:uncharacterized protein Z518_02442 [Rhinocladiella mackenziei CBS 650.93]KIX07788.1 hypothetical protein Z518_02442 [Rhinocladiella mackenziei CBS 650.93]
MSASLSSQHLPPVRLPEPWKTTYEIHVISETENHPPLSLRLAQNQLPGSILPPDPLHHESLTFSDLVSGLDSFAPVTGDNSPWARYHQSLISHVSWDEAGVPTVGQIWNLIYAIVTLYPDQERFRLEFTGNHHEDLSEALQATGIATPRPRPSRPEHSSMPSTMGSQVSISRSAFWQGAASPFGSRPVWVAHPGLYRHLPQPITSYPAFPCEHTVTFSVEGRPIHAQHPIRPPKPTRGAVIYSRYVSHLDEFFSMIHLDWRDEKHLKLFHEWQNDPRVSQGWNETGTLEQHREYLRKMDEDPHQMAILAKFNDTYFAYFEIYWAKEDHMGVYLSPAPGDWDRGRHSLVGDVRYRGPHRASAWWSSLIHYLFLDDPRTMTVVGEPKYTNSNVLRYDAENGFYIHKLADLPHKRSAIVKCERIRFFQAVGFGLQGGNIKIADGGGRKTVNSKASSSKRQVSSRL